MNGDNGQNSWENEETDISYFVPDKVTKRQIIKINTKTANLMASGSGIKWIAFLVVFVILTGILAISTEVMASSSNFVGGAITFLILLSISVIILWLIATRWIFQTDRYRKALAEQKTQGNKGIYTSNYFNDVFIDKKQGEIANSTISNAGLQTKYVVGWDNMPILDNDLQEERTLNDTVFAPFLLALYNKRYSVIKKNIEIKGDISPALIHTVYLANRSTNESVRLKMQLQLEVYRQVEKNSASEYKTFFIISSTSAQKTSARFKNELQALIDEHFAKSNQIYNAHILTNDELEKFIQNDIHDFTFDIANNRRNQHNDIALKYFDVEYIVINGEKRKYSDVISYKGKYTSTVSGSSINSTKNTIKKTTNDNNKTKSQNNPLDIFGDGGSANSTKNNSNNRNNGKTIKIK